MQTSWPASAGLLRHENGLLHFDALGSQVSEKVAGRFLSCKSSSLHVASEKVNPSRATLNDFAILALVIMSPFTELAAAQRYWNTAAGAARPLQFRVGRRFRMRRRGAYRSRDFSFLQPPALLLAMICFNMALSAGALTFSPRRIVTVRAVLLS